MLAKPPLDCIGTPGDGITEVEAPPAGAAPPAGVAAGMT